MSRDTGTTAARVPDQRERERALDPAASFIVQAPAGSGKTELLTQRYLRLLATVDEPEEILAITFTRKAAAEMRDRILNALAAAARGEPAQAPHERITRELARAAADRDRARDWQLALHPSRLRIQTIDSFNAELTRQMPVLSGFGAQLGIVEDGRPLYRDAARRTLDLVETGEQWSGAVETLLMHLDNRLDRVEEMLADMLGRREQWRAWLGHLGGDRDGDRRRLESALGREVRESLARVRDAIPREHRGELAALAAFAAARMEEDGKDSPVRACRGMRSLPGTEPEALEPWLGLAEILTTKSNGTWRRKPNRTVGFPPKHDETVRIAGLIERLSAVEGLDARLHRLRSLPQAHYGDGQWRILQALVELLPVAAAQLRLVFGERGEVDFPELMLKALEALGEPETPTDLALSMDYRLQHILVDEFQDTSTGQFELVRRLTAGWTPDDGRTLFLVGDPMQSIYRFREAEVGLFLRARRQGIDQVPLEPLRLTVNFRSGGGLVDWVNRAFGEIMPPEEDIAAGGVPHSPADAFHAAGDDGVFVHPFFGEADGRDAECAVERVREALARDAEGTVAILVRGRKHLGGILPRLRREGLRFQAVDVEHLAERPAVQDLLALTRAMLHPADRTAWLAVLRAPWCGLSLADLHAVAGAGAGGAIFDRLQDASVRHALTDDGRERAGRLAEVLAGALAHRRRLPLRLWVERTWRALGGPAAVETAGDLEDARAFFELLEGIDEAGDIDDVTELDERLSDLYARPDPAADPRLQVMTIHKAKGLEFDTVILPGLERGGRGEDQKLLMWMERPREDGTTDLLLAPVRAADTDRDRLYRYVAGLSKEKEALEQGRLLYVAATRARRRLHLIARLDVAETDEGGVEPGSPKSGSMLALLWPVIAERFGEAFDAHGPGPVTGRDGERPPPAIRRLARDWRPPAPGADIEWQAEPPTEPGETEGALVFDWASELARHVGTVVHRVLQYLADNGLAGRDDDWIEARRPVFRAMLAREAVPAEWLDEGVDRVCTAISRVLSDEDGRWILDGPHETAASEYGVAGRLDGRPVTAVMDRTFVDERGVRWIVDYKTGTHEGGDRAGFLESERERYREQLERYARLMSVMEDRPIRLGLYFPMLRELVDWEWNGGAAG